MVKRILRKIIPGDAAAAEKRCAALEKRVGELEKQNRAQQARIDQLMTDLTHRQQAPLREGKLLAAARPQDVWVIKCPAPDSGKKNNWGDYHFALSLKKNLEKLGLLVQLDYREDWEYEPAADVVLVLRGNRFYRPQRWRQEAPEKAKGNGRAASGNAGSGKVTKASPGGKSCRYIMWNISHPEDVSDAEYELYDAVCVASNYYAEVLKKRLRVPVYPLLQCTDTEVFRPAVGTEKKYDLVFVGNSKNVYRESVMWAVEENANPAIWGDAWKPFLKDRMDLVQAVSVENDRIPDIYRSAGAVLNDHWEDMRRCQFINNRIFDALACGTPVISDTFPELEKLFPDAVLQYRNREEYLQCIEKVKGDRGTLRTAALQQQERIREEYSFERRAGQLLEIARMQK